jgi:uncharacterized protein Veg
MIFQELLNKKIKLVYEDGSNHYSRKYGVLIEITPTHAIIKDNGNTQAINLSKILRMELLK